jgi:hypothetical protein
MMRSDGFEILALARPTRPGGDFRGFDGPAGHYHRDTAFMLRIAGSRIVERGAVNDLLAMLLQLGAISDPSATARGA